MFPYRHFQLFSAQAGMWAPWSRAQGQGHSGSRDAGTIGAECRDGSVQGSGIHGAGRREAGTTGEAQVPCTAEEAAWHSHRRRDATHSPQQARTPHAELRTPRGRTSPARTPRDPPPAGPVRSPAAPPLPLRRRLPPRAVPSPLPPPPASPRRGCGRGERGPPTAAPTLLPTAGSGRSRRDSPVAVAEPRSRRRAAAPRAFPPPQAESVPPPRPNELPAGRKAEPPGQGEAPGPGEPPPASAPPPATCPRRAAPAQGRTPRRSLDPLRAAAVSPCCRVGDRCFCAGFQAHLQSARTAPHRATRSPTPSQSSSPGWAGD